MRRRGIGAPSPLDPSAFQSAPPAIDAAALSNSSEPVPVRNTFIDFSPPSSTGGSQAGAVTAPGKFIGRLGGVQAFEQGEAPIAEVEAEAPPEQAPAQSAPSRACWADIADTPCGDRAMPLLLGATPQAKAPAPAPCGGYRPQAAPAAAPAAPPSGPPGVIAGAGPMPSMPPPMQSPHLPPQLAGGMFPPSQMPRVPLVAAGGMLPPPPQAAPVFGGPQQQQPSLQQLLNMPPQQQPPLQNMPPQQGVVEVRPLGPAPVGPPRFAPPAYAAGAMGASPYGGAAPPPSYAPACATPAGAAGYRPPVFSQGPPAAYAGSPGAR